MIPSRYMAIPLDAENKALKERIVELENSIEQIRTEIKKLSPNYPYTDDLLDEYVIMRSVLQIIDKHTKGTVNEYF